MVKFINTNEKSLPTSYSKLSAQERRLVREDYIQRQQGKCMYCGSSLTKPPPGWVTNKSIRRSLFPIGFFNNPIHLQHNRKTDMTEGAVHAYCNAVLWQYEKR